MPLSRFGRFSGWFGLAFSLLLLLRLLPSAEYYPPYFSYEQDELFYTLNFLADTARYHDSWPQALWQTSGEYNKGFLYLLLPAYLVAGDSGYLAWWGIPLWSAAFMGLVAVLAKWAWAERTRWPSWIFAATFSLLLLGIQRSKWHPLAYLGSAAVLLALLPFWQRPPLPELKQAGKVGWLLVALSLFLYFGNLAYLAPLLLLFVYWGWQENRQKTLRLGLAALVVGLAINAYIWHRNIGWQLNVTYSLERLFRFADRNEWWRLRDSAITLLTHFFTPTGLFLTLLGLGTAGVRAWKGDRFSGAVWVLLVWTLGMQAWMWGFDYPDCLNWSVVALTLVAVTGADQVQLWLERWGAWGRWAGILVILTASVIEWRSHPALFQKIPGQDSAPLENTTTQLALYFQEAAPSTHPPLRLLLPSDEWPRDHGGFDTRPLTKFKEGRAWLAQAERFSSWEDLRQKLADAPPGRVRLVFNGQGFPTPPPLALPPAQTLLLGEGRYPVPYQVLAYELVTPLR